MQPTCTFRGEIGPFIARGGGGKRPVQHRSLSLRKKVLGKAGKKNLLFISCVETLKSCDKSSREGQQRGGEWQPRSGETTSDR